MKTQFALIAMLALLSAIVLNGCSDDSSGGGGGNGGSSLSGTINYGSGNEHVVVILCEHPIPQNDPPVEVASDFLVLNDGTADYHLSGLAADTYDLFVWIDMDNSNNGEFGPPTNGDKLLADPYYVTVDVSGEETEDFSDFPVTYTGGEAEYTLPTLTVAVNGDPSDWNITPAINDDVGDDDLPAINGTDIVSLYLCRDSEYLYWRMDLADGEPNVNYVYFLLISADLGSAQDGDYECSVHSSGSGWYGRLNKRISGAWVDQGLSQSFGTADAVVEMKIPLSMIGVSDRYMNGSIGYEYTSGGVDGTITVLVHFN